MINVAKLIGIISAAVVLIWMLLVVFTMAWNYVMIDFGMPRFTFWKSMALCFVSWTLLAKGAKNGGSNE